MHRRARRPMMCDEPLAADHWKELPERAIPLFAGCGDLIGFRSSCGFPPPPCFPIECIATRSATRPAIIPAYGPTTITVTATTAITDTAMAAALRKPPSDIFIAPPL